jgi:hypothetical protein
MSWSVYWAYAIGTQAPVAPRFRLATVSRMIGGSCDRLRAGIPSATLVVFPADRKVGRPFSGKHAQYGHNLIVKFSRGPFQGGLANTRESPISKFTHYSFPHHSSLPPHLLIVLTDARCPHK